MAPAYKLSYFPTRGLAETARYLFKYGGIEFEDVRVQQVDWPKLKDKTPFGEMPLLQHKGKQVGQSLAIFRYLAKLVKLEGHDDFENLEIDSVVDTIKDVYLKLSPLWNVKDEARKVVIDLANNEILPFYFTRLDVIVQNNNGYLALGRLTWADFYFANMSVLFDILLGEDSLRKYSNLKALREKVNTIPAIKKWIEVRPRSDY